MRTFLTCLLLLFLAACGGGGSGEPAGGGNGGGPPSPIVAPSALSYPSPTTAVVGTALPPLNPSVTGTVTSYAVAPALPAGLTLNTSSGQITGTPTVATASAVYTITARNTAGSTTFALTLVVNPPTTTALEPTAATTIGTGQRINLFFAQRVGGAPFPSYVDATQVGWTSSNPSFATVDASGIVTGIAEGSTTITARYQSFTLQLSVQVRGAWIARTLTVPGQGTRRYAIYVPNGIGALGPRPALIAMHGGTGTAMGQAASSQLAKTASTGQFYAIFLEGSGALQTFNAGACCGSAQSQNVDDVAFTRAVITDIRANYGVDPAKIYATGFSNGAMMAHRLACDLADQIAGIGAVSGASGEFDRAGTRYFTCRPSRPIPVLHIHAANDRNYPYSGGVGDGISTTNFYGVDPTINDWLSRNNVTSQFVEEVIGASTTCRRYTTRANLSLPTAPVTLCRINPPDVYDSVNRVVFGGGHSWPGGVRSPNANSDVPVSDFDASAYIWSQLNP